MFTRREYLDAGRDIHGPAFQEALKAAHRRYYRQLVTPGVMARVLATFDLRTLCEAFAQDCSFNTGATRLTSWDQMPVNPAMAATFRELGDFPTLGGSVCVYKEAARQLVEETPMWAMAGEDRACNARGVCQPFSLQLRAPTRELAETWTRDLRYRQDREHVLIKEVQQVEN